MFYVKGKSFLSSFSVPTLYPFESETQPSLTASHIQPANKSTSSATEASIAMLPTCLVAAIMLPFLAFLYTIMLMPALLSATTFAQNANVTNDTQPVPGNSARIQLDCPTLPARARPTSVNDLRPDDIKVVAGLGDSVMAAFGAKGVQDNQYLSLNTFEEARGVSFAMGGDRGAITVPNIFQYYSRDLYGASVGEQLITICFGDEFCPEGQYKDSVDILNSAQSGARSLNLNHEIDYLLSMLKNAYKSKTIHPTDWKLLTLFIGSNDICHACVVPSSLPQAFAVNVLAAVDRIRLAVPNVLVQIVGLIRVDEIFVSTQAHPKYCQPFPRSDFVLSNHECMCAHSQTNRTIMSNLLPSYNSALQGVATYYQQLYGHNDTFAVVYQPLPVDISTFPVEAISNVDCFHPSVIAHAWFAKELWKMMFQPQSQKPTSLTFDQNATIYCPTETDRIQLS